MVEDTSTDYMPVGCSPLKIETPAQLLQQDYGLVLPTLEVDEDVCR